MKTVLNQGTRRESRREPRKEPTTRPYYPVLYYPVLYHLVHPWVGSHHVCHDRRVCHGRRVSTGMTARYDRFDRHLKEEKPHSAQSGAGFPEKRGGSLPRRSTEREIIPGGEALFDNDIKNVLTLHKLFWDTLQGPGSLFILNSSEQFCPVPRLSDGLFIKSIKQS